MPQIDEIAPDLNIAEWVQGEPSNISEQKGKLLIIKFFQVNCPGCFSLGFPEIIKLYKKNLGKPVVFWALATAFEDFKINSLDNLRKLILNREVVGETLISLGRQGLLEGNHLSYSIPFPVAWDKIKPTKPEDAHKNAKIIIQRDFPAYTQMPDHTQKKISDQIISYCINKKYTAETFENYQLRGTPSTIVIDKEGRLRCKLFGAGLGLDQEIEKLLAE